MPIEDTNASIEDIIAMNALYRPGPMDYIADFIEGRKHPENITYDCPELKPILEKTYGVIVYQEQVMEILRVLAGYTWGRADLVRRAMSKKHEDEILKEKNTFLYGNKEEYEKFKGTEKKIAYVPGCIANGIKIEAATAIYDKMVKFAKYAFNKSHAAAYSVTSYWTAWLKEYYPAYYLCSVMNYAANVDKLAEIIEDAKEFGLTVLPPDINKSSENCSVLDSKTILFGLSNIKGVGNAAQKIIKEREKRPFTDIIDFLLRGSEDTGSTQKLISAGAFDTMGYNRKSIDLNDEIMKEICGIVKKIKDKTSFIENAKKVIEIIKASAFNSVEDLKASIKDEKISYTISSKTIPTVSSIEKRISTASDAIKTYLDELLNGCYEPCQYEEDDSEEMDSEIFKKEKEVLGVYLTGHPINFYDTTNRINLCDITEASKQVSGIVTNIEKKVSTKGKEYARFVLEDSTNTIKCSIFGQDYEDYAAELEDGIGVRIQGKVKIDDFASTEDDIKYQITVERIYKLPRKNKDYELRLNNEFEYAKISDSIKEHENKDGHNLYIIFKNHAEDRYLYREKVSKSIMSLGRCVLSN